MTLQYDFMTIRGVVTTIFGLLATGFLIALTENCKELLKKTLLSAASNGPVFDLPTTMSKLLHFGMSLNDVVARSTAAPAKILGYEGIAGRSVPALTPILPCSSCATETSRCGTARGSQPDSPLEGAGFEPSVPRDGDYVSRPPRTRQFRSAAETIPLSSPSSQIGSSLARPSCRG